MGLLLVLGKQTEETMRRRDEPEGGGRRVARASTHSIEWSVTSSLSTPSLVPHAPRAARMAEPPPVASQASHTSLTDDLKLPKVRCVDPIDDASAQSAVVPFGCIFFHRLLCVERLYARSLRLRRRRFPLSHLRPSFPSSCPAHALAAELCLYYSRRCSACKPLASLSPCLHHISWMNAHAGDDGDHRLLRGERRRR